MNISQEQRQEAVRLARKNGHTLKEIADTLGTSISNLSAIVKRGGSHSLFLGPLDEWLASHSYLVGPPANPGRGLSTETSPNPTRGPKRRLSEEDLTEESMNRLERYIRHMNALRQAGVIEPPFLIASTKEEDWFPVGDDDSWVFQGIYKPGKPEVTALCHWFLELVTADPLHFREWEADELELAKASLEKATTIIREAWERKRTESKLGQAALAPGKDSGHRFDVASVSEDA